MRRGEILRQRWEDIDFDNRILHVSHSKTPEGEAREIPLTCASTKCLANRKQQGPVFTYEGDPIKIIKTTWASSLRRSGIRHFRFHDLRHTANTRMMLAGVLQEVRREIIGHTSRRSRDVNDRYIQIELPEKREAIRKLEAWLDGQALLLEAGEAAARSPNHPTKTQPPRRNIPMTETRTQPQPPDIDEAIRRRILNRAEASTQSSSPGSRRRRRSRGRHDLPPRRSRWHRTPDLHRAQSLASASVGAQLFHKQPITRRRSYDRTENSPGRNHSHQRKSWVKKTPVDVVLEQIDKQEEKVAEMREELAEEGELTKLQQARKVLEAV